MTSDPSIRRDAQLRAVRRLRVGLVSAGVISSLGVAGYVASSTTSPAPAQPAPSTGLPGTSTAAQDDGGTFATPGDDGGEWGDDGSTGLSQQQAPPSLQQGFGSSHASTGGS